MKAIWFDRLQRYHFFDFIKDKTFLKMKFQAYMGEKLNINFPKTYNEKLQWLKLYDHNPKYTIMVDKYNAKKYVENLIGKEYIVPTIGVWDNVEDINWDILPKQFVIKCTHDSGGLVICKNKENLNIEEAKNKLKKSMRSNYYLRHREWPYKNVPRKIIAEEYLSDNSESSQLTDYKIYTFGGKAKIMLIVKDRGIAATGDYFDKHFKWLNFTWGFPHSKKCPLKPKCFEEMFKLAEILAKETYELRVDFYEVNGKVYFGEMTFFDASGFEKMEPKEWDYILGSWIQLPIDERK